MGARRGGQDGAFAPPWISNIIYYENLNSYYSLSKYLIDIFTKLAQIKNYNLRKKKQHIRQVLTQTLYVMKIMKMYFIMKFLVFHTITLLPENISADARANNYYIFSIRTETDRSGYLNDLSQDRCLSHPPSLRCIEQLYYRPPVLSLLLAGLCVRRKFNAIACFLQSEICVRTAVRSCIVI